ncbi:GTP cyclohydrolase I, partial [Mycobacterium tuberculosis]|nr:GTP cyclohydrolase I [Mycobacterium tuberculosis]
HHMCMSARGVNKAGSSMRTAHFSGAFERDAEQRRAFFDGIAAG